MKAVLRKAARANLMLLGLIVLHACRPVFGQPSDSAAPTQSTIDALRAACRTWRDNTEFKATFRYRQAFTKEWPTSFAEGSDIPWLDVATGRYIKLGDAHRQSMTYLSGPVEHGPGEVLRNGVGNDSASAKSTLVGNLSFDEMMRGNLLLGHIPKQGNVNSNAMLSTVDRTPPNSHDDRCPGHFALLSPLNPILGCHSGFPGEPGAELRSDDFSIESLDETHLRIQTTRQIEAPTPYQVEYQVDWWLEPAVPVIENISVITRDVGQAKPRNTIESHLLQFRECNGLQVPSRIIVVSDGAYSYDANGQKVPRIRLQEWVSDDLGTTEPTPEDFVLRLDKSTMLGGVKNVLASGEERALSFLDITMADLKGSDDPTIWPEPVAGGPPEPRPQTWYILAVANVLGLIVILVYWNRARKS